MIPGESISGTGIPAGAEISSISGNAVTITLFTTAPGSDVSVTISGDNNGTLILDSEGSPGSRGCYQKTNYRGDPHEWGAYGDGAKSSPHDDTIPLENWMGAFGSPPASGSTSNFPTNFGPWIATIPANYQVSSPLVCPAYANLQAPANITSGSSGSGIPPVTISAAPLAGGGSSGFQGILGGQPALIMASPYCRISGIALDATGIGDYYFNAAASTSAMSTNVTYSGTPPAGLTVGMPIGDLQGYIPSGTTIAAFGSGYVTLSQNATGSSTAGETITITGFYTVDVVGTHVGVDSHSLLKGGYDNVYCADSQLDGLQVKDAQIFKAWHDGIHITGNCDNIRVTGDVIQSNGQDGSGAGVWFSGADMTLADGIVEQSGGQGVFITNADLEDVTGMVFAGNNTGATTGQKAPNIQIDNSADATICGNRFQGSGSDTATTSAVLFSGTADDNINLCGNTYTAKNSGSDANILPLYNYDVSATPPKITNTHLYETASQPAVSVYTTAAQPLLQPLQTPQFSQGEFSGLTLSPDGTNPQAADIAAGSAADSTNSTIMQLTSTSSTTPACVVNLGSTTNGAGALDTGTVQANTTYFIYAIAAVAAGNGATTPNCIASQSPIAPTFKKSYFGGTGYMLSAQGGTNGTTTVYNVSPLTGVVVGDAVVSDDGTITSPTTISQFTANSVPSPQPTGSWTAGSLSLTLSATSTTGFYDGMSVVGGCLPGNVYITSVALVGANVVITISNNGATCSGTGTQLSVSGARQLVLSTAALTSEASAPLKISTAYYRMVGAIYTNGSSDIVPFTEVNHTFYLSNPVNDINTTSLGTSATSFSLSVPSGIAVQALGRCIGGSSLSSGIDVLLYSPSIAPTGPPANFPTAPGYSVKLTTAPTAFPYQLFTNTSAQIKAFAASGSATLQCMTDGWVWNPVP